MNPLWTKIGLGAAVIFGVGLAGIAAVNRGKAEIGQLLGRAGHRLPLRLANLGFDLEGHRIGAIKAVNVRHDADGSTDLVHLQVALDGAAEVAGLSECNVIADFDGRRRYSGTDGFRCAAATELEGLAPMGTVKFVPGDLERPLYLPERVTREGQRSGLRSLDASLTTDGNGGVTAKGKFDVVDRHHSIERGSFSLRADQGGAELSVRDDRGRALLDIRASEHGVNVNVSDLNGKKLLRLIEELKN